MFGKKELAPVRVTADPFALLRKMTAELDRTFEDPFFGTFRWPVFHGFTPSTAVEWAPKVDVFEKDHRLFTRIDLPGVKKENVKVEVTDGHLVLSGERKDEKEEKKDNVFRTERECVAAAYHARERHGRREGARAGRQSPCTVLHRQLGADDGAVGATSRMAFDVDDGCMTSAARQEAVR
jgi:HSP20 family molecular chaperone IbpA